MPEIVPGTNTEQKVITVANNDTDINAEITAQEADEWLVNSLTLSGVNMVILFSRNVAIVEI